MKRTGTWLTGWGTVALALLLVTACAEKQSGDPAQAGENGQPTEAGQQTGAAQGGNPQTGKQQAEQTKTVTDWTGHKVEVPVQPKRIIFHGETTGDLAVLGINPIGILRNSIEGTLAEKRFQQVEDIGFPFNVEKALALDPDLIVFGNSDEKQYEMVSKVAPTVTFDTFALLDDRLRTLGKLLDKQEQAEQWLANYHRKEEAMWKQIREGGIGAEETATVFTMYPGNRLFVMARTGLSQILYSPGGLKPTKLVQQALDENRGFVEISFESLPEYAGDHLFMLTPVDAEAAKQMNELQASEIWKRLAPVQQGKVYTFGLIESYSDALSRERILEELPKKLVK